jgi:hypothetical protein
MLPAGMDKRNADLKDRLAAQHALTRELLVADSVEEAAPVYLSAIGTLLSWDAGALWEVPQHDRMLRFIDGWQTGDLDAGPLWAESRQLRLGRRPPG